MHYVYSPEHSFNDRVEGEEASRSGVLIWDALALKGTCHIWIDGEGIPAGDGSHRWQLWEKDTAPEPGECYNGARFYLVNDCPGMSPLARTGQLWECIINGAKLTWQPVKGEC